MTLNLVEDILIAYFTKKVKTSQILWYLAYDEINKYKIE